MTTPTRGGGGEVLSMKPNFKHWLLLVGLLVVSLFWFQGPLDRSSNSLAAQETVSLLSSTSPSSSSVQRGLETATSGNNASPRKEQRNPIQEDEFWLTDSESALLPFDVEFVPPDDSYGELEPMWECNGDSKSRTKKIIFVNIVRSETMEVHALLSSYAAACHVGFASTVMCSGLSFESMKDTWANRRGKGSKSGAKCPLQKDSIKRNGQAITGNYMQANLLEKSTDIVAGQVPLGSHEAWKVHHKKVDVQYVVSLRCPYAWFISSAIDKVKSQNENEEVGTDSVLAAIKDKVESDLSSGAFHEVYARYLITPSQISWIQKEEADLGINHRVELSLTNLKKTNALIIISEQKAESLEKLKYLIDRKGQQNEIFIEAKRQMEKEQRTSPSVSQIMQALKEDKSIFPRVEEYLKYEAEIYEQAKDMHQRQLAWLRKNHPVVLA